jgi:hypothetical protein
VSNQAQHPFIAKATSDALLPLVGVIMEKIKTSGSLEAALTASHEDDKALKAEVKKIKDSQAEASIASQKVSTVEDMELKKWLEAVSINTAEIDQLVKVHLYL